MTRLSFHPAYHLVVECEAAVWFIGEHNAHVFEGVEAVAVARGISETNSLAGLLTRLGEKKGRALIALKEMVRAGFVELEGSAETELWKQIDSRTKVT